MTARTRNRFFSGLTILLAMLLAASLPSAATAYVVKKGDNPSSIAKKHRITVQALLDANDISAKNMKPGTRISIPSRNKRAKAKQSTARKVSAAKTRHRRSDIADSNETAPQAARPAASAVQKNLYHTVRKGDTLVSLSKKYSLSTAELKEINHLKSRRLKNGQRLLVKRIGPKTYVVRKGDTVWKIARKFDMDAEDLRKLNELDGKEIHAGQKLFLEERVNEPDAANYHQILARNVEEELKKTAQSEEFADEPVQDKVVTFAKKMLNIPYKFGGTSILGIDCSGYVKKVYGLLGIELPRTAREQFQEGEAIDRDDLSIGDLVFFRTYASFPSHVGIYMGNNLFIHASSKGKKVTIDSLETPYYFKRFIGGKRLLSRNATDEDPQS
ncbi:MAG: LysM peptidoglycan-binding domain-containing protein [Nitrospiraceae bacterium]|nr:LysM peptidoglycan-binding domain-containing protein [Nitrospiraceae bacterium]